MLIRSIIALLPLFLLAMASADTKNHKAGARAIHKSAIVIDTHADTPGRLVDEGFDLATDTPVTRGHFDFGKARRGNLGAEFFSIWVDPAITTGYAKRAMDMIDSVHEQARRHPDEMVMAYSADDIVKARTGSEKRLATLMGLEGGHAIENDIRLLREYYRLGVRYMTLTWANTNEFADSSGDLNDSKVQHHNGLTEFGKQVVLEMNRLGMMVDVSHVSDKTFEDVIGISKAPVIASHSSARAMTDVPRNMTDDMLREIAKNGGVVQVNFFCGFIARDPDYKKKTKAFMDAHADLVELQQGLQAQLYLDHSPETKAKLDAVTDQLRTGWTRPPLSDLIDHIDHVAKVAGIDHVGIGSDFDGIPCTPQGIDSVADLPKITEALVDRGYTQEQIHKILGGNLLRVFRQVEQVSREFNRN